MKLSRFILLLFLFLLAISIEAYEGGVAYVHYADSTKEKSCAIKLNSINASGISVVGVARTWYEGGNLLWGIMHKDSVISVFSSSRLGNLSLYLPFSNLDCSADSLHIFSHTMGINKKDSCLMNSSLFVGSYYMNKLATSLSMPRAPQEPLLEYMVYDKILSKSARQMIESYLAIKHGITLNQKEPSDYINSCGDVIWSGRNNSDYAHAIAGIGKDDKTRLNQSIGHSIHAPFSPIISANKELSNGMYLLWSHNGQPMSFLQTVQIDEVPIARRWRFVPSGTMEGTLCNVQFRIGGEENLPIIESNEMYYLKIDSSEVGDFQQEEYISYYKGIYQTATDIVFESVNIPPVKSHGMLVKRTLNKEDQEKPFRYVYVHPSPSVDGNIFIECGLWEQQPVTIRIYTIVGQQIYQKQCNGANYYSLQAFLPTSGTYVVVVSVDDFISIHKVLRS